MIAKYNYMFLLQCSRYFNLFFFFLKDTATTKISPFPLHAALPIYSVPTVPHDPRTPLTAIHGYLETLLGGALEERANARRFLEIVFRHTERLGRLLNDLTDLSNIELGKVSLRRGPVRLSDVLGSVLDIVRPKAEAG